MGVNLITLKAMQDAWESYDTNLKRLRDLPPMYPRNRKCAGCSGELKDEDFILCTTCKTQCEMVD